MSGVRPLNLVYAYEWAADEGPGRVALRANARYRDVFLLYAQDRMKEASERVRSAVPEVEMTSAPSTPVWRSPYIVSSTGPDGFRYCSIN